MSYQYEWIDSTSVAKETSEIEPYHCNAVQTPVSDPQGPNCIVTRVQGTVDEIPLEILVDTGPAVTVISESLRVKLASKLVYRHQKTLKTATGHLRSLRGVVISLWRDVGSGCSRLALLSVAGSW